MWRRDIWTAVLLLNTWRQCYTLFFCSFIDYVQILGRRILSHSGKTYFSKTVSNYMYYNSIQFQICHLLKTFVMILLFHYFVTYKFLTHLLSIKCSSSHPICLRCLHPSSCQTFLFVLYFYLIVWKQFGNIIWTFTLPVLAVDLLFSNDSPSLIKS